MVKIFRKVLGKADFFIIFILVNTCCLNQYMWNWPSSSVSHFKGLSYCIFWVPCGTQMVPKILLFEIMISELSNAVSHVLQRILVMNISAIKFRPWNGILTKLWVKLEVPVYRNLQWASRAYHPTLHNLKISIPHYVDRFVQELSCSIRKVWFTN